VPCFPFPPTGLIGREKELSSALDLILDTVEQALDCAAFVADLPAKVSPPVNPRDEPELLFHQFHLFSLKRPTIQ
jgi:hypothetical protein